MATVPRGTAQAVQQVLRTVQPSLKVDGVLGPVSEQAYLAAPDFIKRTLDEVFKAAGTDKTQAFDAQPKTAAGALPEAEVRALVRKVRASLPAAVKRTTGWVAEDDVMRKIRIESRFVPTAVAPSGLFKGLLQMGAPAWTDARKIDASLPTYNAPNGWRNPEVNIRAAFLFWHSIITHPEAAKQKVPIDTWEKLYASHQQGAAGFRNLVRSYKSAADIAAGRTGLSVVDGQSRESLAVVARAVNDARLTRSA